jgi:uncharacterized membrane protein YdjX (TVP38/TMEM64 family)
MGRKMAIDGRQIGRGDPADAQKDPYDSPGVRIVAALVVVVPLVALLVFAYWSGTWFGGVVGGLLGVVSTFLTFAVLWLLRRRRR